MDDWGRGGRAEMDRLPGGQQSGDPLSPGCRAGAGGLVVQVESTGTRFLRAWGRGQAGPGAWLDGPCVHCVWALLEWEAVLLAWVPAAALGQISAFPRVGLRWGVEAGRAGWRVGVPGVPAEHQNLTAWATGGAAEGPVVCLYIIISRFRGPSEEPGMVPPSP